LLQPRCPACSSGPLTERDIANLQNADGTKPANSPVKFKKSSFSIETIASSPGSSSSKEVLTILDSDEEEEEEEQKVKVANGKGKGKAKIQEITLSDSEDDDEGTDASDDYMPSPQKNGMKSEGEDDDEEEAGALGGSDNEDPVPSKVKQPLSAKSDFRSSTKLEALVKSLLAAKEKDPKLKAVVFSQVSFFPAS
jgi:DNA repair protein RAD5